MPEKTFEENLAEILSADWIGEVWFDQQPEMTFPEDLGQFLKSAANEKYFSRIAARICREAPQKGPTIYRKDGWVMRCEATEEERADMLCRVWKRSDKEHPVEFYARRIYLSDVTPGFPTADELLAGR